MPESASANEGGSLAHLKAAALATGVFLLLVVTGSHYSRVEIRRHLDAIAPAVFRQKNLGVAIQREAFQRPEILPLYGSSELVRPARQRAGDLFATFPTGFAAFPVGDRGSPPLITLQQLAAVSPLPRGQKLALILTPSMFYRPIDDLERRQYAGTFSRLRAGEVVFSLHLDLAFKQLVAARMRSAPEARDAPADPFLDLALGALSAGTAGGHLLYRLLLPLGRLQNAVLEWGDHLRVLSLLGSDRSLRRPVPRKPVPLDWSALAVEAEQEYRSRGVEGHAFGFQQERWDSTQKAYLEDQGSSSDAGFLAALRSSTRWSDLELLFRLLRDQETDVLVLSIPLDGPYMDFAGVSATARREYYRRLTGLATRYGLRCLTFEDTEYEPWFRLDPSHPSPKGWVAFDQALDRFYHHESP